MELTPPDDRPDDRPGRPTGRPGAAGTGFVELRTARLLLRRFRPEDAATLAAYRSDPEVARYQSWDAPYPLPDAQALVAELAAADPDVPGQWAGIAVTERDSGRHVGDVAVLLDGDDPRLTRVGITLARDAHGRGYATEALTAVVDDLLVRRGKHRVSADCDARNTASAALLERVGLRREAHHRASAWWKGEWTDEYVYAVLAEEWRRPVTGVSPTSA